MAAEFSTLQEKIDPNHTAVVVIDMQNDFCHSEGAFGKLGTDMEPIQTIMPRLLSLMDNAREAGCQVVIFRVARSPHDDWPAKRRLDELLSGPDATPIVDEGSWGAELCEGFDPKEGDILLTKNRFGGFTATNLDLILRNLEIDNIVMTGVATNICVESTAREGFMLDYNVVLVEDCCATTSREFHNGTVENVRSCFGRVVKADEVAAVWAENGAPLKK